MPYDRVAVEALQRQKPEVVERLRRSFLRLGMDSEGAKHERAREYLTHGAGRRIKLIARSIENIFGLFPPDSETPLPLDLLDDATIQLHAYLINLWGVHDNLAWAYLWNHGLAEGFKRLDVGLFQKKTLKVLPQPIVDFLREDKFHRWSTTYLIGYRDTLAHRISPYIPPATFTPQEMAEWSNLSKQKMAALQESDSVRAMELLERQLRIGRADVSIRASFWELQVHPVLLHFQVLSDADALQTTVNTFLDHWHLPPREQEP
jgi:hypothetical protein